MAGWVMPALVNTPTIAPLVMVPQLRPLELAAPLTLTICCRIPAATAAAVVCDCSAGAKKALPSAVEAGGAPSLINIACVVAAWIWRIAAGVVTKPGLKQVALEAGQSMRSIAAFPDGVVLQVAAQRTP